ncbi:MAG TPA: LLM class F420-dependent oxidoreductase [Acidimicrobiales bacterium]|nr:LLM class F420-dependent oxidoreductase [Acidimicrobiales bacterium]
MKFGVDLGRCNPRFWRDVALAADAHGYESVWIPEHLVFPVEIATSFVDGATHAPVDPRTPTFDPFVMLASIAAVTEHVRLGTHVYNIGLRHPFIAARAVVSLDVVSDGRVEFGIGASWMKEEWDSVGLDFSTRGARVDEAIAVCRRLWTEPVVEHRGRFFEFGAVAFEPKPVQAHIPIHIGGDSTRALRRVAELGDGWIGMIHDTKSFAASVTRLTQLCEAAGRSIDEIQRSALVANPTPADIDEWGNAGATRLIVAPWRRSTEAVEGVVRFAEQATRG